MPLGHASAAVSASSDSSAPSVGAASGSVDVVGSVASDDPGSAAATSAASPSTSWRAVSPCSGGGTAERAGTPAQAIATKGTAHNQRTALSISVQPLVRSPRGTASWAPVSRARFADSPRRAPLPGDQTRFFGAVNGEAPGPSPTPACAAIFDSRRGALARVPVGRSRIPHLLRRVQLDDAKCGKQADRDVRRVELEAPRGEVWRHAELVVVVLEQLTHGEEVEDQGVAGVVPVVEVPVAVL